MITSAWRASGSCAPVGTASSSGRSRLLDEPDAVALGVEEHRDPCGLRDRRRRLHHLAAEPCCVLKALLQPLDRRIERNVLADLTAGGKDAARYAALGAGVHHAVVLRVVGVDLPAEQVAVEARECVEVATGDLEPHHWSRHVRASRVRCDDEHSVVPGGDTVLSWFRTGSGFEPTVLVARMPRRRVPGPGLHALTATLLPPRLVRRADRPM